MYFFEISDDCVIFDFDDIFSDVVDDKDKVLLFFFFMIFFIFLMV